MCTSVDIVWKSRKENSGFEVCVPWLLDLRRFSTFFFFSVSCQKKYSICIKGTLHGQPLSRRIHEPFHKKRSPFRKENLKQAGRPGHKVQAPRMRLASRILRLMLRLFVLSICRAESTSQSGLPLLSAWCGVKLESDATEESHSLRRRQRTIPLPPEIYVGNSWLPRAHCK